MVSFGDLSEGWFRLEERAPGAWAMKTLDGVVIESMDASHKDMYFRPLSWTFAAVDALLVTELDGTLQYLFFQMTVADSHPTSATMMERLVSLCPDEAVVHLVFVVPPSSQMRRIQSYKSFPDRREAELQALFDARVFQSIFAISNRVPLFR